MLLEPLDNSFQDSIQDVDANFAVCCLGRCCGFVKEGEELRPSVDWHLDACDGSDDTGSGVANQSAEEEQETLVRRFRKVRKRHEL
jgi:hypothetical protein